MKLIFCDGKVLEVREVGPVIYRLEARSVPLHPAGGFRLVEEEKARELLRQLRASGLYDGGRVG